MPSLTADKLINKEIFAAKQLNAINASGKTVKIIYPGSSAGIVYSWLSNPIGNLKSPPYLMFYDDSINKKNPYYIKIESGAFKISDDIKKTLNEQTAEEEKQKLADQGPIVYYFQKFAPYVIGTIILLAIIKKKL
jgi:hypothetical protein